MNYQNYFPQSYYQNNYAQPNNPQFTYQQPMIQNQMQQNVPQRVGFIRVQNEDEARAYLVAPNESVTFIDENNPYIYTKTMDASQLDRPKFEKYRLVKEDETKATNQTESKCQSEVEYVTVDEFNKLQSEIKNLKASIKTMQKEFPQKER